jgi:serine protease Do
MSTRKTTLFYALLIAVASLAVGMVIASRLDLTPGSSAQTIAVPPMNSSPITGPLDAQTFRNIAKANTPMVVNVRTEMKATPQNLGDFFGGGQSPDDFFHRFFGGPDDQGGQGGGNNSQPRRPQTTSAAGSGFIITKDGYILTNNHVVENATKIQVSLFGDDERQFDAKLIGRDQLTDSALIQLVDKPGSELPTAKFGDSSQMAPGDWVMAIGNPFTLAYTVTVGVISATQRPFAVSDGRTNEVLQTDAAINPGNSGGPLLNLRGEVIGINSAIITNPQTEGNIGIGFAVPINAVRELLPELQQGKVVRGRIGVSISAVPQEGFEDFGLKARAGAIVAAVTPGGAAAKAGLEPGDVVIQFNGRPIAKTDDLQKMVVSTKPGTTVPIRVLRNKQERTLNVTVDELDLAAEQAQRQSRNNVPDNTQPQPEEGAGFGLTLQSLTPQLARRLQIPSGQSGAVVTDVDPDSPSAATIRPGDVILSVNRVPVSSAADAGREMMKIPAGRLAQLLIWRNGGEVFATVKKQ